MKIRKTSSTILAALAFCSFALNSCYFNSAGFIADAASHRALMATNTITQGQFIYTDGTNYYLEMPHYRFDSPVRLQYKWLWDKLNRDFYNIYEEYDTSSRCEEKSGKVMIQVPADFARYLMGESNAAFKLDGNIKMADNPDAIRNLPRKPVVQLPELLTAQYDYTSPNSGWLYTAAAFDWLIVDLPITLTQNALMSLAFCLFIFSKGMEGVEAPTGGGGGGSSIGEYTENDRRMDILSTWSDNESRGLPR